MHSKIKLLALPCLLFVGGIIDLFAETAALKTIAEARLLDDDAYRAPVPFDFTGRITFSRPGFWFFKDGTEATPIHGEPPVLPALPPGTKVRIHGNLTVTQGGSRIFTASSHKALGFTMPPETPEVSGAEVLSGRYDLEPVRVRGVIAAVVRDEIAPNTIWAVLRTSTAKLYLNMEAKREPGHIREKHLEHLRELIDAEVEVTGFAGPIYGLRRDFSKRISIRRDADITCLSPAPENPFAAEGIVDSSSLHRRRTSGIVIASTKDRFFMRSPANRIIPVFPAAGGFFPESGMSVTVVGFPEYDQYRMYLTEALTRTNAVPVLPTRPPVNHAIEDLFTDDRDRMRFNMSANGALITLNGRSTRTGDNELTISSGKFSVIIDLACVGPELDHIPEDGCTIEASGLCIAEFESHQHSGIFPSFRRFTLFPRAAKDIRIISHPPWWTSRRLLIVIGALGFIIIAILLWLRSIHTVAERRGQELYAEKISHTLAEQKIEERTHLAVELHDSLSQMLTGVALQLEGGETETAKTMLSACRGELRRCLWDLRSRTFEEKDLTEAIEHTLAPHVGDTDLSVRFNVPREQLSESATHTVLRIVRELTMNAIRHGGAKHVRIAGEHHDRIISFSVSDDGCGFDPETAPGPGQGHFGLLGIRERIDEFDGKLTIASRPGDGAKFTVTLNMENENEC